MYFDKILYAFILISLLGITRNSVVNKIVILPLALKRFISQDEISPFTQNYFKICQNGDNGSHFIVKTNLISSQKTHPIRLLVQTN